MSDDNGLRLGDALIAGLVLCAVFYSLGFIHGAEKMGQEMANIAIAHGAAEYKADPKTGEPHLEWKGEKK